MPNLMEIVPFVLFLLGFGAVSFLGGWYTHRAEARDAHGMGEILHDVDDLVRHRRAP